MLGLELSVYELSGFWPVVVTAGKWAAACVLAAPLLGWPIARLARRNAYGPGGGLR